MPNTRTEGAASTARRLPEMLAPFAVAPPQELVDALEVLSAAQEYDPAPVVDVDRFALTVTAKEVGKLVDHIVDHAVRHAARFATAELLDRLQRRAVRAASASAPVIVDELAPFFADAADEFAAAHRLLPKGYADSSQLVQAGAVAVDAFHRAAKAAATLNALAHVRDSLAQSFGAVAPGDRHVEAGTRYCKVRNTGSARRVAREANSGPLGRWGTFLTTDGVEGLHWLSFADQAAYIKALPVVEDGTEMVNNGGFVGARKVPA